MKSIHECIPQLHEYDGVMQREINQFITEIQDSEYIAAAEMILNAQANGNRVHITGIGKPAHVATYGASLLSSTGTPTYFLHGTEAVHGSCGQLEKGDVVICISNSGETTELLATLAAVRKNGCKVISITGNKESSVAKGADVHIFAGVAAEGDALNRAPRASILAESYAVQRLSVLLQIYRGLTPQEYIRWHPGGTLGNLRESEK